MALRSIEIARSYGVRLRVRSTFEEGDGTWIGEEGDLVLEKAIVSGVTHDTSEAKVSIIGVPDRPGIAARVFRELARAGVNIDMLKSRPVAFFSFDCQASSERWHSGHGVTIASAPAS